MQLPSAFNTPDLYKGNDIPSVLADSLRKKEESLIPKPADKDQILTGFMVCETVKISEPDYLRRSPFSSAPKVQVEYDLFPQATTNSSVNYGVAVSSTPELDIIDL